MDQRSDYSINQFNDSNFNMFQPDFMPESDFDNLIRAIGGDTAQPDETFCLDYEYNQFTDSCVAPPVYGVNAAVLGGGTDVGGYGAMDQMSDLIWTRDVEEVMGSEGFGEDDSSDNTMTGEPVKRRSGGGARGDRARTLISERKRRSGMKERLYALRSLVPNITKMDKASIVGDAARYIQDLQTQARNLRSDIATIEAANNQKMSSQNYEAPKRPKPCSTRFGYLVEAETRTKRLRNVSIALRFRGYRTGTFRGSFGGVSQGAVMRCEML